MTKQIPYPGFQPMQAAMYIVGEGLTPEIPADASPQVHWGVFFVSLMLLLFVVVVVVVVVVFATETKFLCLLLLI